MTETNRIEYKQGLTPLGSGIPRILRAYGEESFKFTDNFIRITFPIGVHDTAHVEDEDTKSAPRRN